MFYRLPSTHIIQPGLVNRYLCAASRHMSSFREHRVFVRTASKQAVDKRVSSASEQKNQLLHYAMSVAMHWGMTLQHATTESGTHCPLPSAHMQEAEQILDSKHVLIRQTLSSSERPVSRVPEEQNSPVPAVFSQYSVARGQTTTSYGYIR